MALEVTFLDSDGGGTYDKGVSYTLNYSVYNPDGLIGPNTACNAVNWNYGNAYNNVHENESDDRARCVSIIADKYTSDDGHTRGVSVEFQQVSTEILEKMQEPFLAPMKVSFKAQQDGEVFVDRDINDQPIRNKAGDKFAEGITEPRYTGVLKCTKNFASIPTDFLNYFGKLNGDSFQGFPPKTLKMIDADDIEAEFHPDFGTYYPITIYFLFDARGHKKKPLNEGYRELVDDPDNPDQKKLQHIIVDGEKTTETMLLTEDGKKAPPGAQPIFMEFETAEAAPFGELFA